MELCFRKNVPKGMKIEATPQALVLVPLRMLACVELTIELNRIGFHECRVANV